MIVLIKKYSRYFTSKKDSVTSFLKRTTLPGFYKIPIYDVIAFFLEEVKRDRISQRAAAISFNFLLAESSLIIFPAERG